ncbi:MAG: hypothetical protein JWR39_863 [Devosia sp.]|jgi:flagellin|nr:hypothetical protein [Devosia sp.]
MSDVTLSKAVRSNLLSLQNTAAMMGKTQEKLATGLRVNSAMDNPTNFFTASSLNSRASDLSQLMDSVANSIQTISAADKGISAITDLVEQMKATARSAQQSSSAIEAKAAFTSSAVTGATAENLLGAGLQTVTGSVKQNQLTTPANMTSATTVNGAANTNSLTIAEGDTLTVNGYTISFKATADTTSGTTIGLDLDTATVGDVLTAIETALGTGSDASVVDGKIVAKGADGAAAFTFGGTAATKLGLPTTASSETSALSGKTLSVSVGGASATTVTFGTGASQVNTLEELNDALSSSGARAKLSSDGKLTIETANASESQSLAISGTAVNTASAAAGAGEIFDFADTAGASKTATVGDKKQRVDYKNDYNDLRDQISQLAKDASFNGVNLLSGDSLKVVFNEDGTSSLDVDGVDILETLGLADLAETDFFDSTEIEDVISTLNTALDSLKGQASKFGSNLSVVETRQDFTKNMINVLETGAGNLTLADTNEEAANLLALQTRQSLSSSALSMASQADQSVLQLLR